MIQQFYFLNIYPKKLSILKRYLEPNVHAASFTIAKIWKQLKCLLTKNENVIYINSVTKKEKSCYLLHRG